MLDRGQVADLAKGGDMSGLQMLYDKGQFDECLQHAQRQSQEVLSSYLNQYTNKLLHNQEYLRAGQYCVKYGCPPTNELLPVYKTLAIEFLGGTSVKEFNVLGELLLKLTNSLALSHGENHAVYQEFYQYLFITHLLLIKEECRNNPSLHRIYTKQCISLLRYTRLVRVDKAFLDAAEACKKEGINNMAFVLYNRYLDLAEAIEDENATIDNALFEETDIPSPYEIPLPEKNLTTEDQREDMRDWVLQL